MEIRLIGTEAEIEAAVVIIRQHFIVQNDGGNYRGRNPRYTLPAGTRDYVESNSGFMQKIRAFTGHSYTAGIKQFFGEDRKLRC